MKIKLFNSYPDTCEDNVNAWIKKQEDKIIIEKIEHSSCCTAHGSTYLSVMIVYRDNP